MNSTLSSPHLAFYLTGATLGAALLASFALVGGHMYADPRTTGGAPQVCAGQVSSDQAVAARTAVTDAQATRNRLMAGGSAYAAAKIGFVPSNMPDALRAERQLHAAKARLAAACAAAGLG